MTPTGFHCHPEDHHPDRAVPDVAQAALDRAAAIFRAMGDAPRLRILHMLRAGEMCVTEIVGRLQENFSTVSQRLRVLRSEGLVIRRREGTHLYYALADEHVVDLIRNALDHAMELENGKSDS